MKLNEGLVRTRCQEIEESVERLERIGVKSKEEFLRDQDIKDIACYRLLVAIEAALGMCYHVSAKHLKRVPEEYAECFAILGEAGIIPEVLSQNLQKMARFRNLLIHMYWRVDYDTLYEMIQNNLNDIRHFAKAIVVLL